MGSLVCYDEDMVQLVGILNVTPDSFSDGDHYLDVLSALTHADQLFADGAAIVDVGAESKRPGAMPLTIDQEWRRLEPIIGPLIQRYPNKISVDTFHHEIADRVLNLGKVIINDATSMNNPHMIEVVTRHGATCIVSHLPGTDIQAAHNGVPIDDIQAVVDDLLAKGSLLRAEGLDFDDIILDPGIGFGKTPELNAKLVEFARFVPDYKVMIGYSRKRFLGDDRLELTPNLLAGKRAIQSGAAYLRVHDVAGHRQLLYL